MGKTHAKSTCNGHSDHGLIPKPEQLIVLGLAAFSGQWLGDIQGMQWEHASAEALPGTWGSYAYMILNMQYTVLPLALVTKLGPHVRV